MRASRPARPRFSLFVTILTLFLLVAVLAGTAVTIASYLWARDVAMSVATDTFKAAIDRINQDRLEFFAPAYQITGFPRNDPSFRQGTGSNEAALQLMKSGLIFNPQISAIYVGHENGDYLQVLSISDAEKSFIAQLGGPPLTRFAIQSIRADGNGVRHQTWRFLDDSRQQIGLLAGRVVTYDPRLRDWYRDARSKPQDVIRTPPYLFATTSQVGMTLARAFESGAIGVDITLDRLMVYVRSVRRNEQHRFLAFDEDKRLLAHFDPQRLFKHAVPGDPASIRFATTADLTDPVVLEALQRFTRDGAFPLASFDVAGTGYLATVVRQVARDGGVFFVLYAAPLSDFQGTLADAAKRSLPAALLAIIFTLPAIIFLARSISNPLSRLSREAELIRSFKLEAPIRMRSTVHEINTLIRSMSGMKSTIREVSKFVPKALVKDILESEGVVKVGGKIRRISILFTDVKDFTPIAQGMPAETLMVSLSEYFDELASLIIKESGTVDKFIGDAIFAFWNAPLPVARHEHAACMTALKCSAALKHLNARWIEKGYAEWHTRFGVHVGEAVLGNVGSSDRIDYTAIGDTVNIAARLEGLNKFYGTRILASGQIAGACSDEFLFRRIDRTMPKGASNVLDIFELVGMIAGPDELRVTPKQQALIVNWNKFYDLYEARDWSRAFEVLKAFIIEYPDDFVAEVYIDRVGELLKVPPLASWDGVTRFEIK